MMGGSAIFLAALLLSGAASTSEPSIAGRSTASGVLVPPAPASETPPTPPVTPLAVTYVGKRFVWSTKEAVLVMPDVTGGSGRYEYALATATPLPAGLSFDSATGIFSGRVKAAGDFQFSILVRDAATGAMTTAVARIFIVM
ncbi:hypothetical protein G6M12_01305 [Agrobacterium tumefaciens]|nr:hypothetical protein [Agrobacterium tumefaciens]